jgi:hypothetical protein
MFFEHVKEASFFGKTALWMLQTCLGDAVLVSPDALLVA